MRGRVKVPQNVDKIVVEMKNCISASRLLVTEIKGQQDRLPVTHWLVKKYSFSEEILVLGTKFSDEYVP